MQFPLSNVELQNFSGRMCIYVFSPSHYESEVENWKIRNLEVNMANLNAKNDLILIELGTRRLLRSLITNLNLNFINNT